MTAYEPLAKLDTDPDHSIPDAGKPCPESIERIDAEINAWTEKLKEIEAIKARMRPERETNAALDDLHRLRALGMEAAERNERQAKGLLTRAEQDEAVPGDCGLRFMRVARAVRQIVVLEQELMGLRAMPERRLAQATGVGRPSPSHGFAAGPSLSRDAGEGKDRSDLADRERSDLDDLDDLDDYGDYDKRPVDEVLADLRKVLKAPEPALRPGPRLAPVGFVGDYPKDAAGELLKPPKSLRRECGPPD